MKFPPTAVRALPGEDTPFPPSGGQETILVVEDELAIRMIARRVLTSLGYTVLEAGNGLEALTKAKRYPGPIDLLVTDLVMPGLSGTELAEQMVVLRPDLKVLFVSGYPVETGPGCPLKEPMNAFLPKPFNLRRLAEKVRQTLDR
jgi:CheY-like chemotaxis protein